MWQIDGEEVTMCPLLSVTPFVLECVQLYFHYRNGFLPRAGGIYDQPAKIMKAISVLSSVDAEVQEEEMERNR